MRKATLDDCTYTFAALAEDCDPEDCFATGDAAEDARICADIRRRAESSEWAWCAVRCRATLNGTEVFGDDHLGACSSVSEADFVANSGYAGEMMSAALDALNAKIAKIAEVLAAPPVG